MIYEVKLDGKTLYYVGDTNYQILNPVINQQLNDSGTFEFDVPFINPLYDKFKNRVSMVQVLKDGKELFYGEVRDIVEGADKTKHIYCVGELAFLFCSIQPQAKYQNITPKDFVKKLLEYHNAQVEERKRFELGVVTVVDSNDSIYRFTNYEDTLTALRDKICDRMGGYIRIRKENGHRYLDVVPLEEYGKVCKQPILFGYNLLKYSSNTTSDDIATAVIPLGATLDEAKIEGLDSYLDITSVNDGKDYLVNQEAINSGFGMIKVVQKWDDVTVASNLKAKGEEWLKSKQYESMILELTAIDLSDLDTSLDEFKLGDRIHAIAKPYGMDAYFPLMKWSIHLQEIKNNTITLSQTFIKNYTTQVSSNINAVSNSIPTSAGTAQVAAEVAESRVDKATKGYVYIITNTDGVPVELLLMDSAELNKAKKITKLDKYGISISENGYSGVFKQIMDEKGTISNAMWNRVNSITKNASDYSNDDVLRVQRITSGSITPTQADFEKYDLNNDGVITTDDANTVLKLSLGTLQSVTKSAGFSFADLAKSELLSSENLGIGSNYVRAANVNATNGRFENMYARKSDGDYAKGITQNITVGSTTLHIVNGLIVEE